MNRKLHIEATGLGPVARFSEPRVPSAPEPDLPPAERMVAEYEASFQTMDEERSAPRLITDAVNDDVLRHRNG